MKRLDRLILNVTQIITKLTSREESTRLDLIFQNADGVEQQESIRRLVRIQVLFLVADF